MARNADDWRKTRIDRGETLPVIPEERRWLGGMAYALPRQQWLVLFREYGYKRAIEWGEELILWPDARRPDQSHYMMWAKEFEAGKLTIDDKIDIRMQKRVENQAKVLMTDQIKAAARASTEFSKLMLETTKKVRAGEDLDEQKYKMLKDLSSTYMHANNASGFNYGQLMAREQKAAPQMQVGRLVINAGEQRSRPKQGKKQKVIEAEYSEA